MNINAIYSHNQKSEGAKALSAALDVPRIKHRGSSFEGTPNKTIINWGSTSLPDKLLRANCLNRPERVAVAVGKHSAFMCLTNRNVTVPEYTTSQDQAWRWLEREGHMVFARTLTRASGGEGIVIMDPEHPDTWNVRAPLYTKYVKKKDEYRVHVVRDNVIDVQRKGLRQDLENRENTNWKIRNLANGFIYVRNDGKPIPDSVRAIAVSAIQALELDFGAVDIIYNSTEKKPYVLEVNTAPGLQGQTVTSYANAFKAL